jgi:2-polyprenyl-3-methyl-5-hydroxy-6-metoxy-1,4-benzoquinol methylase
MLFDDDAGIAGWTTSGLNTRFRNFRRCWRSAAEGTLWLDIGCGAGTYSRFLAQEGLRVIGIDYSLPTLLKARTRSRPDVSWITADITQLPLRANAVDGVLCFGVLQAIPSVSPALRAMAEVIRPGGTLWIDALNARCIPNRVGNWRRRVSGKPAHLRYDSADAFAKALDDSGFDVVSLHWLPILPGRLHLLQPLVEHRLTRWFMRRAPMIAAWVSHSILVEARRRDSGGPA